MPTPIPTAQRVLIASIAVLLLAAAPASAASLKTVAKRDRHRHRCRTSDRDDARSALRRAAQLQRDHHRAGVQVGRDVAPPGVRTSRHRSGGGLGEPARRSHPCPHAVLAPARDAGLGPPVVRRSAAPRPDSLADGAPRREGRRPLPGRVDDLGRRQRAARRARRRLGHGERALLGAQPLLPHARRVATSTSPSAGRTAPTRAPGSFSTSSSGTPRSATRRPATCCRSSGGSSAAASPSTESASRSTA